MSGPVQSDSSFAGSAQLDRALDGIGVTSAHKTIIWLILIGCLFDSFEQNSIGLIAPLLRQQWGLTATDIGMLNTVTFAAAAVGRLVSGYIADRWGRRVMLTADLLLFTLGAVICAIAPSLLILCVGRAIVGFGLGGEVAVAVTMLAEFCSQKFRGTAVGLVNVGAGGIGNFLAPAFGLLVFAIFPGADGWRWLFASLVLPAILGAFYRRLIPETPRFLLSKGRIAETNGVLSKLATGKLSGAVPVTSYISGDDLSDPATARVNALDIFRGKLLRRTASVGIAIWMTYGAQISVLTLMPMILVGQGYTITRSLVYTLIMQGGSFAGTLAASLLGYHLPRKRVLTVGAVLACLAALAFGFLAKNIVMVLACGALFQFFVLMLNTTIWIYAPELFPTRVRAFGTSFILATGTTAGALMPLISGRMLDTNGVAGVFGMIAVMYAIFTACIRLAPETYGHKLDETAAEPEIDTGAAASHA
ncbi:MFS transporter [Paraburkholderia susongensis]|uniref:MFS transporter, putative metabolite:H+ symporter n=1 Tax=Paraburkholderia susongensis TaxID=1515439 RepID=A0A1X7L8Q5_9BURK|nr:MFS transporter [Paraburkholderia susongensis]SMG49783.1 MFS transporter, putative metabolite:H+ symporter [Paraburkholderia susongensis]